jgi:hypothetical protein
MSILVQPTVSNFGESELPFDDAERVFHLCPDPRLISVPAALAVGQRPVATAFAFVAALFEEAKGHYWP